MERNRVKLSAQVRRAVDESGMSRYAICKAIGMDQSIMSRFMNGKGGLQQDSQDALADLLGLDAVMKGKSMKSHDRNTKGFRQLTLAQMRASIASMQRHLNDAKRVYAQEKQRRQKGR